MLIGSYRLRSRLDESSVAGHSQAADEATRDGTTAIDLIDGDRLCELLKENKLGVATEMRRVWDRTAPAATLPAG
jgi:restriction endonuclease Mrr